MEREPEADIITYSQFLEALRIVKKYGKQIELHNEDVRSDTDAASRFIRLPNKTKIKDIPLSRRTMNVLRNMEGLKGPYSTLADLGNVSRSMLLQQKNLGKRTMFEIEELCLYTGIEMLE